MSAMPESRDDLSGTHAPGRDDPGHAPNHASAPCPPESDIRLAQDLLFFAYRDFTNAADVILEELGLGRAHHRALHFIGRNPGITVSDLLSILRITKQSLARVLSALMEQDYVAQVPGASDRRQRLLTLTAKGEALERRLFERQMTRLSRAFLLAGETAVDGFRVVLRAIMDDAARAYIDGDRPGARRLGAEGSDPGGTGHGG